MITWLDELRLEPGPPYATMGTHALDLDDWLVVDGDRSADLARKAELLASAGPTVFAALPGSERAAAELDTLVREWLAGHGIDPVPPQRGRHPLVDAALNVQEDLAVLQRDGDEWVLTAGVVCFPTHWNIAAKIGLPLAAVHEPVAHFAEELRDRMDRFFDRLVADRPVWRRNWVVVPTNELHLPDYGSRRYVADYIQPDGAPMWLRSERQTLRRLADTGAIVFTIRVQQAPLGVLRTRPDLAAKMLATTRSWDDEKRTYTSTGGVLDGLIDWLDGVLRHN